MSSPAPNSANPHLFSGLGGAQRALKKTDGALRGVPAEGVAAYRPRPLFKGGVAAGDGGLRPIAAQGETSPPKNTIENAHPSGRGRRVLF